LAHFPQDLLLSTPWKKFFVSLLSLWSLISSSLVWHGALSKILWQA
jgi:amino acid transporter